MATAASAKTQIESGQTLVTYAAMTDSGDHQTFTPADAIMSGASGKEPAIRPNGMVTGLNVVTVAVSGSDDVVDVAAFTAYSGGTLYSVSASTDESITRATPTDTHIINSITMTSAGAIAVVAGTGDTAFSETRGADGGPPLIPVDSVEIAQIRLTANSAAPITAAEIFQVVGQHTERYDFPVWETDNVGQGSNAAVSAQRTANVKFASAMPLIHTGPIAKKVYAQYYTPIFADISKTLDFQPAETAHTVSSSQYYDGTVAASASSLGQGQFTALLDDGISDSIIGMKNDIRTVKFFPDRNKSPYMLTQGKIGISRTFPVADQVQATVTVSAENATAEFTS